MYFSISHHNTTNREGNMKSTSLFWPCLRRFSCVYKCCPCPLLMISSFRLSKSARNWEKIFPQENQKKKKLNSSRQLLKNGHVKRRDAGPSDAFWRAVCSWLRQTFACSGLIFVLVYFRHWPFSIAWSFGIYKEEHFSGIKKMLNIEKLIP